MFDLFAPVKCLLKEEPVQVDDLVFRLHSKVTVLFLAVCAILVTAKQFVGDPITCITDSSIVGKYHFPLALCEPLFLLEGLGLARSRGHYELSNYHTVEHPREQLAGDAPKDKEPINAYCWIYSTFTVSRHLAGITGREVASPGVGQVLDDDEIHHHRYYQWVCFVLALQAILFYLPRALWTIWERNTVWFLSRDLSSPFLRDAWTTDRKSQLVEYFTSSNLHSHNFYALRYFTCEFLNFFNVVAQIYLLDLFLEGQFTKYGPAVAAFAMETNPFQRVDPMARLFPKVAKCTFHTFGSAGSTQTHDALCVLPLNVVNEKIFVFIWFWFFFLAATGAIMLIYRIIVFSQPWARIYLLRASARVMSHTMAETVVRTLQFGDWFLLQQLAHNLNPIIYRELIRELAREFDKTINIV